MLFSKERAIEQTPDPSSWGLSKTNKEKGAGVANVIAVGELVYYPSRREGRLPESGISNSRRQEKLDEKSLWH